MEDPAEEVNVCVLDWLGREEVVFHACDAGFEFGGDMSVEADDCVSQVLDDAFDVWVLLGDG